MKISFLRKVVLENDTRAGKFFDLFIQAMIIVSIISFSVETLPNLSAGLKKTLRTLEYFVVIVFSIEYFLRVVLSKKPYQFIFSFFGVIDFLSVLPFYVSTGVDLRSLRAFRLLRLFKLFRYSKSIKRVKSAFKIARQELTLFTSLTIILLYLSAVGIHYFEKDVQPEKFSSIFHSLWWSVCTLATVGYGDVYPVTTGGKIFTFLILMIGLGIIAIPAGIIASALSRASKEDG